MAKSKHLERAQIELLTGAFILGARYAGGDEKTSLRAAADDLMAFRASARTIRLIRKAVKKKKQLNLLEILHLR